MTFEGPLTVADFGPVPLTRTNTTQNVYHYGDASMPSPINMLLMNGIEYDWRVPPGALRSLVPDALAIDTFDGDAFVGIVPFTGSPCSRWRRCSCRSSRASSCPGSVRGSDEFRVPAKTRTAATVISPG